MKLTKWASSVKHFGAPENEVNGTRNMEESARKLFIFSERHETMRV